MVDDYTGYMNFIFGEFFARSAVWDRRLRPWFAKLMSYLSANKKRHVDDIYRLRECLMKEFFQETTKTKFSSLDVARLMYPSQFKYPTPTTYQDHIEYVTVLVNSLISVGDLKCTGSHNKWEIDKLPVSISTISNEDAEIKWARWLTLVVACAAVLGVLATAGLFNSVGKHYDTKIANIANIANIFGITAVCSRN